MSTLGRAFVGAAFGILCAWAALPLSLCLYHDRREAITLAICFLFIGLPLIALLGGLPALILSWMHAALLGRFAERAGSVGRIRRVGVLLGIPLGVVVLCIVLGMVGEKTTVSSDLCPYILSALAGGAGLGWGASHDLRPSRSAPALREAPISVGRQGAPFFDNRLRRAA